jgi:hypothetical protein
VSKIVAELGDESGSLGEVVTPFGMILDGLGDFAEPGQWWS